MQVTMDFDHTSGEIIAPKVNGITKRTTVYYTIRDQCPKLLSRIIDNMHRRRRALMEMFGTDADWDVKSIIGELSEIRYRLMTDKPLQDISDEYSDYRVWNDILAKMRQKNGDESVTWYKSDWLFVECYLHRRIYGAVYKTKVLNNYDIFADQKVDEFTLILKEISDVITFMISNANDIRVSAKHSVIETLLKMCMWGNGSEMTFLNTKSSAYIPSTVEAIHSHDGFILCSDLEKATDIYLLNLKHGSNGKRRLDIVLDNAGFELICELILAEYLMNAGLVDQVICHGKAFQWFISNVTRSDFDWTFSKLKSLGGVYTTLYHKINLRLQKEELSFSAHPFWTFPNAFCEMPLLASDLYKDLSASSFIIFSGDLNYRKLVGDREWPYQTAFKSALCGFCPAPLLVLRTLKTEIVVGLNEDVINRIVMERLVNSDMITGKYAVAQLSELLPK